MSASLSRISLGLLAAIFALLGIGILIDPQAVQEAHGLDFSTTPASGMAEIRAYYFGSLVTFSWLLSRGARGGSSLDERRLGLMIAAMVLLLFVAGRLVSYVLDGPPRNRHAEVMWAAELIGGAAALALLRSDVKQKS